MKKFSAVSILFLTVHLLFAQQAKEPILVTDMLKIKTAEGITCTNDGTRAAFTVKAIIPDEKNKADFKYQSQVYIVDLGDIKSTRQITFAKEGAAQPAWSPDGKMLAFVRTVEEKPQIFLLAMNGGEPWQLTKSAYGATDPAWSPDGKKILFASDISLDKLLKDSTVNPALDVPLWPYEKPGFATNEFLRPGKDSTNPNGNLAAIRKYLDGNVADKKAVVLNKLNFQNETNISADMNVRQFFTVEVTGTAAPVRVVSGFNQVRQAVFTPDGRQLILSGDIDSLESPDRRLESEIFIANADGSNVKMMLGAKGKRYSLAVVSTGGKWLAYLEGNTSFVDIPSLNIMPLQGATEDAITIPVDRSVNNVKWSSDDRYLYFTASSNGGVPLYRYELATKKLDRLSTVDEGIIHFDLAGDKIVYAKTAIASPSEVFVADAQLKKSSQVTALNEWVKDKQLAYPEKKSFVNSKGLTVEYWVMKPIGFKEGRKYPVLLEIHGGPSAMWGPGEASMWHEFQYFAAKGYGVVYANPRGSGGYGSKFLRANVEDWGTGPASDVLTALDKTVAAGWADTSNLYVTGGSYGGYLVAWIISHDKRFKAACSQRGVYDLTTFFGEGNAWRLVPNYFGGYPWEPKVKEILGRQSPFTYVKNITTPYIIFHGGNDRRTGFVQGEMMYRSLKVLGRPVEYVVHPGAGHEITRSGDNRQRIDQLLRTYEFFSRWGNQ